ncbi:serine hydrolase domain-containing protein [Paucihalobacter sp.]|uniref:serine hydrolase domain-containing protein n=1 Tax=Paucihalobacter sp. TaxID=2850405 RepID=UPI002FDF9EA7
MTLLLGLLGIGHLYSQSYEGFSKQDIEVIHKQWSIDNWDDGGELSRYTFLNMTEFWTHAVIKKKGKEYDFTKNYRPEISDFKTTSEKGSLSLQKYLYTAPVDGMIIVRNNAIIFEAYPRMFPEEKHVYMSVTKIVISTLIAILEDRKQLDASKSINFYLPELEGTGWEQVPIIDILDMASGIDCLETVEGAYENPENCIYQYEATLGFLKPTETTPISTWEHIKSLKAQKETGKVIEYSSVNTFVLAELIERITNKTLAQNIEEEIWQKMGAEADALMAQTKGVGIAHAGLSSTLRDLARFGTLFLPAESAKDTSVISNDYLNKIQNEGRPEIYSESWSPETRRQQDGPSHNSYQWDLVMQDGDFYKEGFGGQGLYISPSRNLVIAFFGTADQNGKTHELPTIARQLAKSGLFD